MKIESKNLVALRKEFGERLVTLNSGAHGIRGGMNCTVREVGGMDAPMLDFIGSDNSVDRYNEQIDQAGWQLENFRANPVIPDCHDYSSIGKILGRAFAVQVVGNQLVNRVEFCLDNPLGKMAYQMAKGGFIKSQSVGFIPLEWTNGNAAGQPDRTYTKQELLEISLVVVPANPGATIGLALKSGALEKSDVKNVIEHLKQFCSDTAASETDTRTLGAGSNDVQLLRFARDLKTILGRA